jgi:spore germination protein YaaH
MKNFSRVCALLACFIIFSFGVHVTPLFAATSDLEVSGWIPYWAAETGSADAKKHLEQLSVINPFAYTVQNNGALKSLTKLSKSPWKNLFTSARKKGVLVIPTVMWSNTSSIHVVLSNEQLRKDHIKAIVSMVKKGKYDGVDIDYEGKMAETKDFYSLFLKELKSALGKDKTLSCTIEARTPPDSLYKTIPPDLRYANDYDVIATYCDRVNLMTYDQQRADLALNDAHIGQAYIPVSDPAWVRKVIALTLQSIPKEKINLGIPTYGHEYEVQVYSNEYQVYGKTGAFNPAYGIKTAKKYHITPEHGNAGELSFSFFTVKNAPQFAFNPVIPQNTSSANKVAAQSFAYTTITHLPSVFYYATWSDADAIEQKMELAREFGLNGVAFFKFDGKEDQNMWKLF